MTKSGMLCLSNWELHHPGGVNQVIINLYNQAQIHGDYAPHVLVASWRHVKIVERQVDNRRTTFLRLRYACIPNAGFMSLVSYVALFPKTVLTLSSLIKTHNIRVINAQYPTLNVMSFVLLKRLGLFKGKIILTFQGLDIANAISAKGLERKIWIKLFEWSDHIVACSENLRQRVISFHPKCESKVVTIYNGVDVDDFRAKKDANFTLDPKLEDKRLIVNVANFEHKKGQDILLRAFKEIAQSFPDVHLILIGRSGVTLDALTKLIETLELQDSVTLFRDMPHNQVPAALENATLFVLPSREEPFGIALLEAGAFGLPVIATRVGGIPEFIIHGESGRLVPSEDVQALATEIADLLQNPSEQKRLGKNLKELGEQKFAWTNIYRQYQKLF